MRLFSEESVSIVFTRTLELSNFHSPEGPRLGSAITRQSLYNFDVQDGR